MAKKNRTAVSAFPLLALGLFFLAACGGDREQAAREKDAAKQTTETRDEFVSPMSKKNALVVWTALDPLAPVARAFEALIEQHNLRNPDQNVGLVYLPEEDFDRRITRLEREEIPPDLFIVPDRKALAMARTGLLLSLEGILAEAKLDRSHVYEAAWRALEADGKLWGLPVCANFRLRFVNMDRMREEGVTTDSLNLTAAEAADWDSFLGGGVPQIEGDFSRLLELYENPDAVNFRWAAFTRIGDAKVAEDSIEFLAIAAAKRTRRSFKEMFPLFRASQSPAMASILRAQSRRIPVLAGNEGMREFLSSVPIRGPWLDDFGRDESLLQMPEIP